MVGFPDNRERNRRVNPRNRGVGRIRGYSGAEPENKLSSVAIDPPDQANPVREALGSVFQPLSMRRNTIKNRTASPEFAQDRRIVESYCKEIILTALAEQTRPLNIPVGRIESIRAISKASRRLEQDLHRFPSTEELAAQTGKMMRPANRIAAP